MIKNQMFGGNPFAPFANRLFPNPYVHVSFEEMYRSHLRHYLLASWVQAPWELTVKGERLQGFFGPVFLLLPLGLLSLRGREGRRLALAGAIFALPWFLNIGTRFLIPALPPLTLALALALRNPSRTAARDCGSARDSLLVRNTISLLRRLCAAAHDVSAARRIPNRTGG